MMIIFLTIFAVSAFLIIILVSVKLVDEVRPSPRLNQQFFEKSDEFIFNSIVTIWRLLLRVRRTLKHGMNVLYQSLLAFSMGVLSSISRKAHQVFYRIYGKAVKEASGQASLFLRSVKGTKNKKSEDIEN